MTNESENVSPALDDSFWEHLQHLDFKAVINLGDGEYLNIMGALESIYSLIKKGDTDNAAYFTTGLAATLIASKYGKHKDILNEMMVHVFKEDMDKELEKVLNEKP